MEISGGANEFIHFVEGQKRIGGAKVVLWIWWGTAIVEGNEICGGAPDPATNYAVV